MISGRSACSDKRLETFGAKVANRLDKFDLDENEETPGHHGPRSLCMPYLERIDRFGTIIPTSGIHRG